MAIAATSEQTAESEQRATFEGRIRQRARDAGALAGMAWAEAFKRMDNL
jgi:hypothetical protein